MPLDITGREIRPGDFLIIGSSYGYIAVGIYKGRTPRNKHSIAGHRISITERGRVSDPINVAVDYMNCVYVLTPHDYLTDREIRRCLESYERFTRR